MTYVATAASLGTYIEISNISRFMSSLPGHWHQLISL
jgi:hypothetical protein